jgi:hypothetical protein
MKKSVLLLLAITSTVAISSCKKYSDGGLTSKADKRLTAYTWKLDKYLRNGNDETSQLLITNFSEKFAENGTITRSYIDPNGNSFSETGTWTFDNDKMQINLTGVGSIELTNQTSTVSSSDYNIIRLKKDELWYYYENGGSRHEFHLIK